MIGWALGEHAVWSKYSNFDVAVHVPLIISIPMVTSHFDNYDVVPINHVRYNAQITNTDKMENKISLKYILDVGEIGVSNTSTEYVKKYKRTLSGGYVQRGHNKSVSSVLYSKKHYRITDAIVELVDIFPTIADLAGIPIPICQVNNTNIQSRSSILFRKKMPYLCGEGITLLPLIKSILECQVRHTFYCIVNYTNVLYKTKGISL